MSSLSILSEPAGQLRDRRQRLNATRTTSSNPTPRIEPLARILTEPLLQSSGVRDQGSAVGTIFEWGSGGRTKPLVNLFLCAHLSQKITIRMSVETRIQQIQTLCDRWKDKREGAVMSRGIWDVYDMRDENKVDAPRLERVWSRRARHKLHPGPFQTVLTAR
jgi:hypothetical protein